MANAIATALLGIMVAVIILSVTISGFITPFTTPTQVSNESHESITYAGYTLDNIPVNSIISIRNKTKESQTFTTPNDYNISLTTGLVNMSHSVNTTNYYYYEPTGYISDGSTRNILSYIGILLVLIVIISLAVMIRH